jgi:hypothetical protein
MLRHDKVKINKANGQIRRKIATILLYWLHSFPLACFIFSTNDELVLLTIEGKWLETIVHMAKFEFLDLSRPKQVELLISICICGKFQLWPHMPLLTFKKISNNLSHKWKPSWRANVWLLLQQLVLMIMSTQVWNTSLILMYQN